MKARTGSLLYALRAATAAACMLASLTAAAVGNHNTAAKQQTFASPEQAAEALAAAWHGGNKKDLLRIFGPAGMRLVSSGDAVAEKEARDRLASAYDAVHKIELESLQKATLILGYNEFPYPIPLVKQGDAWYFDTKAGADEILDRRIGRNELNAIEVCRTYVEAQRDYAAQDPLGNGLHEYAKKVVSSRDRRDGLYWKAKPGEAESPLGPLVASAAAEGYGAESAPYHGYYYRILTKQGANAPSGAADYMAKGHMTGGFALIAYPAKYGDSGIMTFIVNQNGIVFEKNLGAHTASIARRINAYDPDRSWNTVQ